MTLKTNVRSCITVLTEMNNRSDEVFADFYSNRKASSTARQTHSEEAQADIDNALSAAKVGINSELSSNKKDNSVREHRVYHGTGADFDAFDLVLVLFHLVVIICCIIYLPAFLPKTFADLLCLAKI